MPNKIFGQGILPPAHIWQGKSEKLIVDMDHTWITPAEKNEFRLTPDHATTFSWIMKLSDASEMISFKPIGLSAQNRPILMVIASREEKMHTQDNHKGTKPNILIQAGIHSGEIDGKDAGLMLLRDIAFGHKSHLLDKVNLLFIPILNVDGHENAGPFNRPNQRGPENMGWRTNARNLNLNRDYSKLETEGVRAVVEQMKKFDPVFYIDIHVTDGADYQYDITYGYRKKNSYSPQISNWLTNTYKPLIDAALSSQDHIPGPLVFTYKGDDFENGIIDYYLPLRFSDAYGDARHIPSILVENHSLKPYKQRVLGTYVFLESTIKALSSNMESLSNAIESDMTQRPGSIPLGFGFSKTQKDSIDLKIIGTKKGHSKVTGREYTIWTGEKYNKQVPYIKMDEPQNITELPKAYWIPAEHKEIIDKLALHGLEIQINKGPKVRELIQYYIEDYEINPTPSEGRFRFKNFTLKKIKRSMQFEKGSARISTDQPLGILLTLLLEPNAADSFFQWGYFHSILSRTEYIESYVMGPLIEKMLAEDENLEKKFEEKKGQDENFANDPNAIFKWFYANSPYFDKNWKVIPIGIEY